MQALGRVGSLRPRRRCWVARLGAAPTQTLTRKRAVEANMGSPALLTEVVGLGIELGLALTLRLWLGLG